MESKDDGLMRKLQPFKPGSCAKKKKKSQKSFRAAQARGRYDTT